MSEDPVLILKFDTEHGSGEHCHNSTFGFNCCFSHETRIKKVSYFAPGCSERIDDLPGSGDRRLPSMRLKEKPEPLGARLRLF
jgi:hypothetical protein